ncbi:MAG: hypothetical protein WDN06_14795 [Asticcacaulis sp.]
MRGNAQDHLRKVPAAGPRRQFLGRPGPGRKTHLQHAEHYFRMIRQMQPQRPVSEFVQRDPFLLGLRSRLRRRRRKRRQ